MRWGTALRYATIEAGEGYQTGHAVYSGMPPGPCPDGMARGTWCRAKLLEARIALAGHAAEEAIDARHEDIAIYLEAAALNAPREMALSGLPEDLRGQDAPIALRAIVDAACSGDPFRRFARTYEIVLAFIRRKRAALDDVAAALAAGRTVQADALYAVVSGRVPAHPRSPC
jgi:hypothetical protein